jgi:SAM-dependent methyltransferase
VSVALTRRARGVLTRRRIREAAPPEAAVPTLLEWCTAAYRHHVAHLLATHERDEAMALAIGGHWSETAPLLEGALELGGLPPDGLLVDVGCGAGRLAERLAPSFAGRYLGLDVVEDLVAYAAERVERPGWRFSTTAGTAIPLEDDVADCVCFFSVFTHLPHEAIYAYLGEARRVLRPGGTIVASFLEFVDPALWPVFAGMVDGLATATHLNQFVHRDEIVLWCAHLGLEPIRFIGATEQVVPVHGPEIPHGTLRHFGQALMVLGKPGGRTAEDAVPPDTFEPR